MNGQETCTRCSVLLNPSDHASVLILRLMPFDQRNFGQYRFCADCMADVALYMRLPGCERDSLRLYGGATVAQREGQS